jgi:hypothetical protein
VRCVRAVHRDGWSYLFPFVAHEMLTALQNAEPGCPSDHENFIALDHNVDVPPDLCILDEDVDEDADMLLAYD